MVDLAGLGAGPAPPMRLQLGDRCGTAGRADTEPAGAGTLNGGMNRFRSGTTQR
jgi:hypothetical protein